jgi:hypothetical protein
MNTDKKYLRLDSFFTDRNAAITEQHRIIRQGGKAYVRRFKDLYRLRVQKNPA